MSRFFIIGELVSLSLHFEITNNGSETITAGTPIFFWLPFGADSTQQYGIHPFSTRTNQIFQEIYIRQAQGAPTDVSTRFVVEYTQDFPTGETRRVDGLLKYRGVGL